MIYIYNKNQDHFIADPKNVTSIIATRVSGIEKEDYYIINLAVSGFDRSLYNVEQGVMEALILDVNEAMHS